MSDVEDFVSIIVEGLDDCELQERRELAADIAAGYEMTRCPPFVNEAVWLDLRRLVGDSEMRRLLWAALNDGRL